MIAKKTQLLTVAAVLLIQFGARANDIEPGTEFYTANPAANPIVLDGENWDVVAKPAPEIVAELKAPFEK